MRPLDDDPVPLAEEERELLALAEELRAACPDPELDEDFAATVRERLAQPWTLRRTLDSSPLARLAATLMILVVGVAPVIAVARMLPWFRRDPPPIGYILPREAPALDEDEADAAPPEPPAGEDPFSVEALVQADRMRRAAQSFRAAGPGAPDPVAAPRILLWESASAQELWEEFVRRCARDAQEPLPAALAARVLELAREAAGEERRSLAPWLWILRGDFLPQAEARAAYAWAGAPWLGGR